MPGEEAEKEKVLNQGNTSPETSAEKENDGLSEGGGMAEKREDPAGEPDGSIQSRRNGTSGSVQQTKSQEEVLAAIPSEGAGALLEKEKEKEDSRDVRYGKEKQAEEKEPLKKKNKAKEKEPAKKKRKQAKEKEPDRSENDSLDEIDEKAVETMKDSMGNRARPGGEHSGNDISFDVPGDTLQKEEMVNDDGGLMMLKNIVNARRSTDLYLAVCVARVLNRDGRNPLARTSAYNTAKGIGHWAAKAMDSVNDVSNMVSAGDAIYGTFFSEDKNTKSIISIVTNSVTLINSGVNVIRRSGHIIENIYKAKRWTLESTMEAVGILSDCFLAAAKAGNVAKAVITLRGGKTPVAIQRLSKALPFLTATSQLLSLINASTAMIRKGNRLRELGKEPLANARNQAVEVINRCKKEEEVRLDASQPKTDHLIVERAEALLSRDAAVRRMMQKESPSRNHRNGEERDRNREEPSESLIAESAFHLADSDLDKLVTYLALHQKIDHETVSLVKGVPGLVAGATGIFSNLWSGTNNLVNEDGSNAGMTKSTRAFSTISNAVVIGNSAYKLGDKANELRKAAFKPTQNDVAHNLTGNYLWRKFAEIADNDDYGLKGLDQDIGLSSRLSDENRRQAAGTLSDRVLSADRIYKELGNSMQKLYVPTKQLTSAKDIAEFKRLLTAGI